MFYWLHVISKECSNKSKIGKLTYVFIFLFDSLIYYLKDLQNFTENWGGGGCVNIFRRISIDL
jgi:hypothetical protein